MQASNKATCFKRDNGKALHHDLDSWRGRVYEKRWATVSACVLLLSVLKSVLCWGWDSHEYSLGDGKVADQAEISKVDGALTSDFLWGCMIVLQVLSYGVDRAAAWANSCRCHWGLECDDPEVMKRWRQCAMRGRRLPEVSAGDFVNDVRGLLETSHGKWLASLSALSLGKEQVGKLVHGFELVRSNFLFIMVMKTCPLAEAPGALLQLGHPDDDKCRAALVRCLASKSQHPQIRALQSDPLEDLAISYSAGEELSALPELELFISRKLFGWSSECTVEGQHARVERTVGNIVNRSEA